MLDHLLSFGDAVPGEVAADHRTGAAVAAPAVDVDGVSRGNCRIDCVEDLFHSRLSRGREVGDG